MSLVFRGKGSYANQLGVNTGAEVLWYPGGYSHVAPSSIGGVCYDVDWGIAIFASAPETFIDYTPAEFALSPLYGGVTGRRYLAVDSTPQAIHSSLDFTTWVTASLPSAEVFRDAAMGSDGLYVVTSEVGGGFATFRVRRAAPDGALSLITTYGPYTSGTAVSATIAVASGVVYCHYQTAGEVAQFYSNGTQTGQLSGSTGWGYAVTRAFSPMGASDGVYATYTEYFNQSVTVVSYRFAADGVTFTGVPEWGGAAIMTQSGIVADSTVNGDALLYVGGLIVERVSSAVSAGAYGALTYVPPFWTNKIGCTERT